MRTKDYVRVLTKLNLDKLRGRSHDDYYATVSHGFVEELLELYLASDNAKAKELGDVWAYGVLLLVSEQLENVVHMLSYDISESLYTAVADEIEYALGRPMHVDLPELALGMAGGFKRYFREETGVSASVIAAAIASATASQPQLKLADVLKLNIDKLTDRKERGLLYKGNGDER